MTDAPIPVPGTPTPQEVPGSTVVTAHGALPSTQPPETSPRTRVEHFDPQRLNAVGARPPLGEYLRELWVSRHFVMYDARVRLSVSQDHTLLGKAWVVLNPLLMGLTFYLIFGLLLRTGEGTDNFVGYIIVGLIMFQYSTRSVVSVSRSMRTGKALIRGFAFPRAALTLSIVLRDAMTHLYALGAMFLLVLVIPPLEPVSWTWLLLIPVFLVQTVFNWGLGMLLAPLVNKIPDVSNLLSFFMRLWMYASGIFYDPSHFVDDPRVLALFHFNPLYQVLSISRQAFLQGQAPGWSSWAVLVAAAVVVAAAGLIVFWVNEESYANER